MGTSQKPPAGIPKSLPGKTSGHCVPALDAICEKAFSGVSLPMTFCGKKSIYGGLVPLGLSHSNTRRDILNYFMQIILSQSPKNCNVFPHSPVDFSD